MTPTTGGGTTFGRGYGPWDGLGSARHVIDEEEVSHGWFACEEAGLW
ncbi:MAG TPA: hypothetical protein VJA25_12765 [Dehalococcoidia bacterium]|nr:hypothetical protein [Dehalococcoidia bacterium]